MCKTTLKKKCWKQNPGEKNVAKIISVALAPTIAIFSHCAQETTRKSKKQKKKKKCLYSIHTHNIFFLFFVFFRFLFFALAICFVWTEQIWFVCLTPKHNQRSKEANETKKKKRGVYTIHIHNIFFVFFVFNFPDVFWWILAARCEQNGRRKGTPTNFI